MCTYSSRLALTLKDVVSLASLSQQVLDHGRKIDPLLNATLKCKQTNQSVALASSDQGLTTTRLCSTEIPAIFSDFRHFQAGSVDFKLIMVKRCVWGTFKSDACYSASFEGDLRSLPFQNETLKSVTSCSGLNCSPSLIPC